VAGFPPFVNNFLQPPPPRVYYPLLPFNPH
jgi:hypothetical protein